MYGSIARVRLHPGSLPAMQESFERFEEANVPGARGAMMFRMDEDPDEYFLVAVFDSKEAYHANAQDPAQNERYMAMREHMQSDPEWHDGEIVISSI